MISEVQSRIQRVNCRVKSENRLPALDVFRGLALLQLGFMLVPDIMENIFCICRNFGRNALLMYILSELVQSFLWSLKTPDGELVYP